MSTRTKWILGIIVVVCYITDPWGNRSNAPASGWDFCETRVCR